VVSAPPLEQVQVEVLVEHQDRQSEDGDRDHDRHRNAGGDELFVVVPVGEPDGRGEQRKRREQLVRAAEQAARGRPTGRRRRAGTRETIWTIGFVYRPRAIERGSRFSPVSLRPAGVPTSSSIMYRPRRTAVSVDVSRKLQRTSAMNTAPTFWGMPRLVRMSPPPDAKFGKRCSADPTCGSANPHTASVESATAARRPSPSIPP